MLIGKETKQAGDGLNLGAVVFFRILLKNMYLKLTKDTVLILLKPHIITQEANAVIAALEYWKKK
jgi:hypothetical protein